METKQDWIKVFSKIKKLEREIDREDISILDGATQIIEIATETKYLKNSKKFCKSEQYDQYCLEIDYFKEVIYVHTFNPIFRDSLSKIAEIGKEMNIGNIYSLDAATQILNIVNENNFLDCATKFCSESEHKILMKIIDSFQSIFDFDRSNKIFHENVYKIESFESDANNGTISSLTAARQVLKIVKEENFLEEAKRFCTIEEYKRHLQKINYFKKIYNLNKFNSKKIELENSLHSTMECLSLILSSSTKKDGKLIEIVNFFKELSSELQSVSTEIEIAKCYKDFLDKIKNIDKHFLIAS